MALQTTVIFVVVLVLACRHSKRKAAPAEAGLTIARSAEGQYYETMDPGLLGRKAMPDVTTEIEEEYYETLDPGLVKEEEGE